MSITTTGIPSSLHQLLSSSKATSTSTTNSTSSKSPSTMISSRSFTTARQRSKFITRVSSSSKRRAEALLRPSEDVNKFIPKETPETNPHLDAKMAASGELDGKQVKPDGKPFWDYDSAVEDLNIGDNARKQAAYWRTHPIRPFIDPREEAPEYNPIVDDWIDMNNPRWKALKHHFAKRSGPFFIGTCVSAKNPKTAMIAVPYWKRWLKLGKYVAIKRTSRIMAHDPEQLVEVGDVVEIRHSRPYSKRKHFIVKRVLKKEPGNAFLREHPEFAVTRARADLKRHAEEMRNEELKEHEIVREKKAPAQKAEEAIA